MPLFYSGTKQPQAQRLYSNSYPKGNINPSVINDKSLSGTFFASLSEQGP